MRVQNDVDEDAETEGFFDTQAGGALKYTIFTAIVFCLVLGIMYAFLRFANVPVTRYIQTLDFQVDMNSKVFLNTAGTCIANMATGGVSAAPPSLHLIVDARPRPPASVGC